MNSNKKEISLNENKKDTILKEDIKKKEDSNPSWYHYIIVLIIFGIFFGLIYSGFNYFSPKEDKTQFLTKTFNYPYKVGNITYNIKFNYPINILKNNNFVIEPNKIQLLNTINYKRVFYHYNGTDNGKVAVTAIKVRNFLKYVYRINFIKKIDYFNETNCSNSTLNSKIMIFKVNSNRTGVFFNKSNGCTTFETTSGKDMIELGDKFIYSLIKK